MKTEYITPTALVEGGWSRTLITALLGAADKTATNPHYRKAPPMRLYDVSRVAEAAKSPEFLAWLEAKRKRQEKAEQTHAARFEKFFRKYGDWKAALGDGCEYLFSLNRYAKHPSCTNDHREAIYALKTDIVELLYKHGYATECFDHLQQLPGRKCFGCNGTGIWSGSWRNDLCRRCDGSGLWGEPFTLRLVCFRFSVGGKAYCWHQPEDLVCFTYEETANPSDWKPGSDVKAVALSSAKFAAAKDLLRWIIAEATAAGQGMAKEAA